MASSIRWSTSATWKASTWSWTSRAARPTSAPWCRSTPTTTPRDSSSSPSPRPRLTPRSPRHPSWASRTALVARLAAPSAERTSRHGSRGWELLLTGSCAIARSTATLPRDRATSADGLHGGTSRETRPLASDGAPERMPPAFPRSSATRTERCATTLALSRSARCQATARMQCASSGRCASGPLGRAPTL